MLLDCIPGIVIACCLPSGFCYSYLEHVGVSILAVILARVRLQAISPSGSNSSNLTLALFNMVFWVSPVHAQFRDETGFYESLHRHLEYLSLILPSFGFSYLSPACQGSFSIFPQSRKMVEFLSWYLLRLATEACDLGGNVTKTTTTTKKKKNKI